MVEPKGDARARNVELQSENVSPATQRFAVKALVMLVLACGCGAERRPIGPFVHSVSTQGYDLVVEKCWISLDSDDVPVIGQCTSSRQKLPSPATR